MLQAALAASMEGVEQRTGSSGAAAQASPQPAQQPQRRRAEESANAGKTGFFICYCKWFSSGLRLIGGAIQSI